MIRLGLLVLPLAACVVQPPPVESRPPAADVMQPCQAPLKPAVAPHRPVGADVFAQLRAVTRWSSDVQLAREDTAEKLADCAGRLTRAQDWIRQRDRGIP